jgi:hypothetical protein
MPALIWQPRAGHRKSTLRKVRPRVQVLAVPRGRRESARQSKLTYCTLTMRCMVGFPEPNQLALRLCTFGPTERYSCTQIPRKAIFWADLDHFWKVSSPKHVSWVRYRVTYVRRPLRYRYLAIHLTVCVQYQGSCRSKYTASGLNRHHRAGRRPTHVRRLASLAQILRGPPSIRPPLSSASPSSCGRAITSQPASTSRAIPDGKFGRSSRLTGGSESSAGSSSAPARSLGSG